MDPEGYSRRMGSEGTLATVHVRCRLWVYLGLLPVITAPIKRTPGKDNNYPEAFGIYLQPFKHPGKTGGVLATEGFWGSMGCLGGFVGWITGVWLLTFATVRTRCARGAATPCGGGGGVMLRM